MGIPVWELQSPRSYKTLDLSLLNLDTDWLVFTEQAPAGIQSLDLLSAILKAAKAKPVSRKIQARWSPFTPEHKLYNDFTPRLIVIMGEYPAQVLLHTFHTLEELTGRMHSLVPYTCPVIVTHALSSIEASIHDKRRAWQDIQMGMRLCQ